METVIVLAVISLLLAARHLERRAERVAQRVDALRHDTASAARDLAQLQAEVTTFTSARLNKGDISP